MTLQNDERETTKTAGLCDAGSLPSLLCASECEGCLRRLSVHRVSKNAESSTKVFDHALQPEADPKCRDVVLDEEFHSCR